MRLILNRTGVTYLASFQVFYSACMTSSLQLIKSSNRQNEHWGWPSWKHPLLALLSALRHSHDPFSVCTCTCACTWWCVLECKYVCLCMPCHIENVLHKITHRVENRKEIFYELQVIKLPTSNMHPPHRYNNHIDTHIRIHAYIYINTHRYSHVYIHTLTWDWVQWN